MKIRSAAAALVAALVLAPVAALAQEVTVDYDRAADFSKIATFAAKIATPWGNEIGEKRVLAEFEAAFAEKGWKLAPEAEADALVMIHGSTEERKSLSTFYSGYAGYRWRGVGTSTTVAHEYTVGTLVVDIYDAKTKSLLWRGTATGELKDSPEKRAKQVAKASDKLLKSFPPPAEAKSGS